MPKIDFIQSARQRRDKEGNPKPNLICELNPAHEIKPGDSYRKASGRSGGGFYTRIRCAPCPTWYPWDLSDSLSNRLAEIVHNYEQAIQDITTIEDFEQVLDDTAEAVTEIAEEKRESADNMEQGFGHETEQSAELNEIADELESWANDIDAAKSDIPELPDLETGEDGNARAELTDEQIEAWREEATSAVDIMDNSPY
jgi:DNA repair exonuclease SbcCD ATPase subunit